jgi:RNA polymerase sigma factor (sigma-70 family)
MMDDAELLRRYADDRDETAFAGLVQRYLTLVYGVALRKVAGDVALAEDVTQSVFADLARKAKALSRRMVITGWLFTSTQFAAAKAVRSAQRRRAREQEAYTMQEQNSETTGVIDWERLRPTLDNLIGGLNERDREAVLLRFFEEQSFPVIGARLRISEDAARSRVDRALEKIKAQLARRGIASTSEAVALALAGQTIVVTSAGLAANVTSVALTGAATAGSTGGVFIFMSMTKVIGIVGALAVAGGIGFWHHQMKEELRVETTARREQAQELAKMREENGRLTKATVGAETLRAENAELAHVRSELSALKQQHEKLLSATSRKPELKAASVDADEKKLLQPGMLPVDSWRNVGHATPDAAFQTELWASVGGDVDLAAKSITFSSDARAKAQALLASLPENIRAQYGTPERMGAFLMASGTAFAGMQVVGQSAQGPDDVLLNTQWQYTDGRVRENQWQFHRNVDGTWQRVIPPGLVDKWGMILRGNQNPPAVAGTK